MNKFSERLKQLLKENNMTQAELARRINLSSDAVNCYCNGKREANYDTLIKICKVLNESADYLLGLTDL